MANFQLLLFALCCHYVANKVQAIENHVKATPLQDVYEFWLSVDYRLTMAVWDNDQAPPIYLNFTGDQKYYYRKNTPMDGCTNYNEFKGDFSKLIIGNGFHRDVIAVNDSIPAPSLIVYSGSTVIVHVTNNMDDPVSIHWHGLDQRGTFFMDGVTPLTQCPIGNGQTFTYKFKITDPPGTYWYHGHSARDRSDGLFGALIVLDPFEVEPQQQDLIAVINDWYPEQADFYYKHVRNDNNMFTADYEDKEKCFKLDRDTVGSRLGVVQWNSAIVNGRGWYNMTELKSYADRLPLEEFKVESDPSKPIRIRLINAGMVYGLLFSVDQHKMTVVASDASNILPVEDVDFVHVNPGERYDVILKPMESELQNKRFPVRIRSMEKFDFMLMAQEELENDHFGMAWLVYDEAPKVGYTDEKRECTKEDKCKVVNCPFEQYPDQYNRLCINYEKLRSTKKDERGLLDDEILRPSVDRFEQHFLNFGFQDHVHTINGLQFRPPSFPPFMHPGRESEIMKECSYECGRKHKCACTHHVNLTLGNTVELVLYNRGPGTADAKGGFSHPVHLHGHHFYVLKTAWPTYDSNGLADQCTEDITCDNFYCDFTSWNGTLANRTVTQNGQLVPWQYVNDDGYKPLLKDTVYVPFGGYVVVRFKADNPGWWFSHCHILIHASDGMEMFFREGTPEQMPQPPDDYPMCGITFGQMRQKQEAMKQTKAIGSNKREKLTSGLLKRRIGSKL